MDVAVLEALGYVIDASVTAHGNNTVVPVVGGITRHFGAVMNVLSVANGVVKEVVVEVLFDDVLDILLSAGTGNRIDDKKGLLFQRFKG